MPKKLFRTLENLLDKIDHSAGDEKMLEDLLHLLVESDETVSFGVVSGRLYREEKKAYRLIKSIGGHGPAITGRTVSKDYQVVRDVERRKLWIISPQTPGWDPAVESQFSDLDSAAILVGRDPAYILALGIRHHGSETDLMILLETLRAAVSLKLREQTLANQMRQARIIQQSLVPRTLPILPGFEIAATSHPAEEVGGDVYDVQWVEEDAIGLMMADASGHGLPAALQARDVVTGLRMGQAGGEKITATMGRLNGVIHRSGLSSRFISLFYGELDEAGNMAYVNGGHPAPILVTPAGEVFELKTCGPVLGPLPDATYRRGFVTLRPDEILVLYTDGVTERLDPDSSEKDEEDGAIVQFGPEGIAEVVRGHAGESAESLVREIVDAVRGFGDGAAFEDDVSVMVVKRLSARDYPPSEDLTPVSTGHRR